MPNVNHVAVLVAAVAYWIWGALWFTVFGGTWLALLGKTKADMNAGAGPYLAAFVVSLVVAYGVALALARREDERSLQLGVSFAGFVGILFLASNMLTITLFERRPLGLWLIDAGHIVLGMMIVGAIVGGWKSRVSVPAL